MVNATVHISGMGCQHCVDTVTKIFISLDSVKLEGITLTPPIARITFDTEKLSESDIKDAIVKGGYDVEKIEYGT